MYLSNLSDIQKELFLDLCIDLSKSDDNFAKEEKMVIDQLCDEMNIKPKYESSRGANQLIAELASISSKKEKRIIVIELLGIVMADKTIAKEEEKFMNNVLKSFGIAESELNDAIMLVNKLYDVYAQFGTFLNK